MDDEALFAFARGELGEAAHLDGAAAGIDCADMDVLPQRIAHGAHQLLGVDGLGDDVGRARLHRTHRRGDFGGVLEQEDRHPLAHRLDATQHGDAVLVADALVEDDDIRTAALERGEEARGIDGERGLESLEPEQDAECLARRRVGIENVDEPVTVEECVVVDLVAHRAPSRAMAGGAEPAAPAFR